MKTKDSWIYKVFFMSFFLAAIFSAASNYVATEFNDVALVIIIIFVIIVGIVFDVVGVSVLTANESTYHAKAAQKVKGAKESVNLLRNASKASSFCNDVIGDICGIVSGGLGAVLALSLSNVLDVSPLWVTIAVTALISALTVGCKAMGKKVALDKCDSIVFMVGRLKNFFKIK